MHTINRHNYEAFFLLYVDNELSAADRLLVDQFIRQNPDLANELQQLQQAALELEPVSFLDKEALYRQAGGIQRTNYPDYFLLYTDRELDAATTAEVEIFVLQNPDLQDEFTQLAAAVLPAEPIAFPGKASLYRRETGKRRLLPLYFRIAAAVTGLLLAGATLLLLRHDPATDNNRFALNGTKESTPATAVIPTTGTATATQHLADNHPAAHAAGPATQNDPATRMPRQRQAGSESAFAAVSPKRTVVTKQATPVEQPAENNTNSASTVVDHPAHSRIAGNNDLALPVRTTLAINPVLAGDKLKEAGKIEVREQATKTLKVIDVENDDQQRIDYTYIAGMPVNKNKVRSFVKGAGRLIGNAFRLKSEKEATTVNNTTLTD
jgi:hypothetical protein